MDALGHDDDYSLPTAFAGRSNEGALMTGRQAFASSSAAAAAASSSMGGTVQSRVARNATAVPMLSMRSSANAIAPVPVNNNAGTEIDGEIGGDVSIPDAQVKLTGGETQPEQGQQQQQQQQNQAVKESPSDAAGALLTLGTSPRLD